MTPDQIRRLIAQSLDSPTCTAIYEVIMQNKSPMSAALTDALYPSMAWRIAGAFAKETADLKAHLKLRENCCLEAEGLTTEMNAAELALRSIMAAYVENGDKEAAEKMADIAGAAIRTIEAKHDKAE